MVPYFFLYIYIFLNTSFSKFNIFNIFHIFDILINFYTFIFIYKEKKVFTSIFQFYLLNIF